MSYTVTFLRGAQRNLNHLPKREGSRILAAISQLADSPRPSGSRKLHDREGWRIRVGDYRVVYRIDDAARRLIVLAVGHRSDVYR
jgi:mRNA interferase RelE/StbE